MAVCSKKNYVSAAAFAAAIKLHILMLALLFVSYKQLVKHQTWFKSCALLLYLGTNKWRPHNALWFGNNEIPFTYLKVIHFRGTIIVCCSTSLQQTLNSRLFKCWSSNFVGCRNIPSILNVKDLSACAIWNFMTEVTWVNTVCLFWMNELNNLMLVTNVNNEMPP